MSCRWSPVYPLSALRSRFLVRLSPRRGDSGAEFIEYAALIMLISTIAAAVLMASVPGSVGDFLRQAMCEVQNATGAEKDCGGGSNQADDSGEDEQYDFSPEFCVRNSHTETVGGEVEFGVFSLGSEYKYAKQTLSDGTVFLTMQPSLAFGKDLKGGGGVDTGQDSLKKETGAGLKGFVAPGNMYFLRGEKPGETGEEQFQRLKEDIEQTRREEQQDMWGAGQGYQMGRAIGEATGHYEPPDLPEPDIKSGTFGANFNADGPISQWVEDNKNSSAAVRSGEKVGLTTGDDWNLELGSSVEVANWYDEPDNTKTATTYTYKGSGDGALKALGGKWAPGANLSGATRIMRNEDGSLKNIRYSVTIEGQSKSGFEFTPKGGGNKGSVKGEDTQTITSTQEVQIDFDTPEEQEIGQDLLGNVGLMPPPIAMDSMINPLPEDGGRITQDPGEDAAPWDQLFYERGRLWQYFAHGSKDAQEYGGSLKAGGISFGASFGWSEEIQRSFHAQILEGPENGERSFVEHEDCIAPEYRDGN